MKHSYVVVLASLCLLTSGCTHVATVQLMPRTSGKTYMGEVVGKKDLGQLFINIDGEVFSGLLVETSPSKMFDMNIRSFGVTDMSTKWFTSDKGVKYIKGLLQSNTGHGLRCEFATNRNGSATGVCIMDDGTIYDAIWVKK